MYLISNISIPLNKDERDFSGIIAEKVNVPEKSVYDIKIVKKAVDARKKQDIKLVYTLGFNCDRRLLLPVYEEKNEYAFPDIEGKAETRPVVVGFGPAGMFAALTLAKVGLKPIVVERGKDVDERRQDVQMFWEKGILNPESNVQFGEGGAGTFSDGKLTTGTKDVRQSFILKEMVKAGAPEEILYLAKPHIGTDKLHDMVKNIRLEIIKLGGEVRFQTKLVDFLSENGRVKSVILENNGEKTEIMTDCVILAIGHSARDTVELLYDKKLDIKQKQFSMGVRIEHKREKIDEIQYGEYAGHTKLGAADYKLSCHLDSGRGVYTFCMCPGGVVVAAASEEGGVVTNGMSRFKRDDENSNSALLVGTKNEDFKSEHPLAGMWLQREIEKNCFEKGGGYKAPAQLLGDFMNNIPSVGEGRINSSYRPDVTWCNLNDVLPRWITDSLREAIFVFNQKMRGFMDGDAVLIAPETRSSSPVTILRDEHLESTIKGIYPCGEGAGYAGGIVSASVDGVRCAEKYIESLC